MLYFIIPAYGNKVFSITPEKYEEFNKEQFTHYASKHTDCSVNFDDIQPTSKPIYLTHIEALMLRWFQHKTHKS
jgi:hypothetical protein